MPLDPDRVRGALLGVAIGDALGLPCEGLRPAAIARRFGRLDRYRLLGRTGFVSDDTEQSALLAHALLAGAGDPAATLRDFRRRLAGWFLRLPWGIGLATLRACLRLCVGVRRCGVSSAGNGAAMRAIPLGLYLPDHGDARRRLGAELAAVTHTHPEGVAGALFVAELAARCAVAPPAADRADLVAAALLASQPCPPELAAVLRRGAGLDAPHPPDYTPPNSGWVRHSLEAAVFFFVQHGHAPLPALQTCIANGGDTDSIAAILGGWLGALHGESAWPPALRDRLHDGPFGPSHLRALADALCGLGPPPRYSAAAALLRNLALYPVILAHGFRRLLPI